MFINYNKDNNLYLLILHFLIMKYDWAKKEKASIIYDFQYFQIKIWKQHIMHLSLIYFALMQYVNSLLRKLISMQECKNLLIQ